MSVVLDRAALHHRLKGRKNRLSRLVAVFLQHYQAQLAAISSALSSADAVALRESAHTYKGTVNSFDAPTATSLALELEHRGRDAHWEGAAGVFSRLQQESEELRRCLEHELSDESWHE